MKFLLMICFALTVFAQAPEPSGFDKFASQYGWIVMMAYAALETAIGYSKIKSNSTLEMLLSFIKGLFGKK